MRKLLLLSLVAIAIVLTIMPKAWEPLLLAAGLIGIVLLAPNV